MTRERHQNSVNPKVIEQKQVTAIIQAEEREWIEKMFYTIDGGLEEIDIVIGHRRTDGRISESHYKDMQRRLIAIYKKMNALKIKL